MKYREVKSLIIGFVFSVSAMTACGVYGAMEEQAAVYGSPEMGSEQEEAAPVNYRDKEEFYAEPNDNLHFAGIDFFIASVYKEVETGDEKAVYVTDTTSDYPAELTFITGSYQDYVDSETCPVPETDEDKLDNIFLTMIDKMPVEKEEDKVYEFYQSTVVTVMGEEYPFYEINTGYKTDYVYFCGVFFLEDRDHFVLVRMKQHADDTVGYREELLRILENSDDHYSED